MSLGYSICATLDTKYGEDKILEILNKGFSLNYQYYEQFDNEYIPNNKLLTANEALKIIVNNEDDLHRIIAQINDTYVDLFFINDADDLVIMFTNFTYPWLKQFNNNHPDIDIAQYTHHFLNLIEEYKIKEMRIEKD